MHGYSLCLSGFISVFIYGVSALRRMAPEPWYAFQLDDMNYWTVPHALSYLRSGFARYWWLYFGASGLFRLFICRVTFVQRSSENVFIVFFSQTRRYNYFSNIGPCRRISESKKKKRGNVSPRRPLTITIKMELRHSWHFHFPLRLLRALSLFIRMFSEQ